MLHKVIDEADEADVILIVLDARDPPGCHSRLVW
jgi:ribosome biogenesis GTPase A